jgi:mRNA-degrading endonuclease RelE of RelBE toxin-antitoxin system
MSYNIFTTESFDKELKRLAKKYPSIKSDFKELKDSLEEGTRKGDPLGKDCYKI